MARSKEQWQAQKKRGMCSPPKAKSAVFQFGRPVSAPASRAPSTSSAIFQLGRPVVSTSAPTPTPVAMLSPLLKPDPHQASGVRKEAPEVIDLISDDEEEEEDEALEEQNGSANRVSTANQQPMAILEQSASVPNTSEWKIPPSELITQSEEVESDVDEEWPIQVTTDRPMPGNSSDGAQERAPEGSAEGQHGNQQPQLQDDDEMEVDEELPSQAPAQQQGETNAAPTDPPKQIVEENLEDGEIYEEGAVATSPTAVKRTIAMERQASREGAQPVDPATASGVRPLQQRGKKQKKRGKKKSKRKLAAMQMLHDMAGGSPADFERMTRRHPFADAPPPGPYTHAMMNAPGAKPVDRLQGFSGAGPPPPFVGPPSSFPRPDPRHLGPPPPQTALAAQPRPPFDDSQILRVNRHGNMEMFNGEVELPPTRFFPQPPATSGGFKYRSVPWSPPQKRPQPVLHGTSESSELEQTGSQRGSYGDEEKPAEEDFDLDSLRAAALRTKRPGKSSVAPGAKSVTSNTSVASSSSSLASERTQDPPKPSEPASSEIDELRAEIFRSMMQKWKKPTTQTPPVQSTPPATASTTETEPEGNKSDGGIAAATDADKTSSDAIPEQPSAPVETSVSSKAPSPTSSFASADATTAFAGAKTTTKQQEDTAPPITVKEIKVVTAPQEQARPAAAATQQKQTDLTTYVETTPEFRPLTASSQSVVVRFSLDDGSPRKGGTDTGADASKASATSMQSIHTAIEEMRQKIAAREKQRESSRLAANGAAKSSSSSSASASASSSPPRSAGQKKNDGTLTGGGSKTSEPAVPPVVAAAPAGVAPANTSQTVATVSGMDIEAAIDDVKTQIAVDKEQQQPDAEATGGEEGPEGAPADENEASIKAVPTQAKPTAEEAATDNTEECAEPASKRLEASPLESNATSAIATSPQLSSRQCVEVDTSACTAQESEESVPMDVDASAKLDYAAIRKEYEQCVAECAEAEERVARLSSEMAQLKQQLSSPETTAGGP